MDRAAILHRARTLTRHAGTLCASAQILCAQAQITVRLVRLLRRLEPVRLHARLARGGAGEPDGVLPVISTGERRCPFCKSEWTINPTGRIQTREQFVMAVYRCASCQLPFVLVSRTDASAPPGNA